MKFDRLIASIAAVEEARRQMEARSGPIYDLARERSRILSEAYRAAGRPRDVSMVRTPEGWEYMRVSGHGLRSRHEPATEAEWLAWRAWAGERDRLRRELNIWRGRDAARGGHRSLHPDRRLSIG